MTDDQLAQALAEAEALRVEVRVLRAKLDELEHQHGLAQKRKQRRIDSLTEQLRELGNSAL